MYIYCSHPCYLCAVICAIFILLPFYFFYFITGPIFEVAIVLQPKLKVKVKQKMGKMAASSAAQFIVKLNCLRYLIGSLALYNAGMGKAVPSSKLNQWKLWDSRFTQFVCQRHTEAAVSEQGGADGVQQTAGSPWCIWYFWGTWLRPWGAAGEPLFD